MKRTRKTSATRISRKQAQIAQLVEQRTENPRVTGSIPVLGITQEALASQMLYIYAGVVQW